MRNDERVELHAAAASQKCLLWTRKLADWLSTKIDSLQPTLPMYMYASADIWALLDLSSPSGIYVTML